MWRDVALWVLAEEQPDVLQPHKVERTSAAGSLPDEDCHHRRRSGRGGPWLPKNDEHIHDSKPSHRFIPMTISSIK